MKRLYLISTVLILVLQGCKEHGPGIREEQDPDNSLEDLFTVTARPALLAIQNRWTAALEASGDKTFSTDNDHILKDGSPFFVRGVVYVPGYPGYLPWDIENAGLLPQKLRNSIDRDILQIKAVGANTVRFWGAPAYCYESLRTVGDLFLIQTIWIDTEVTDLHDPAFKESTKSYIRSIIDRIYSVYPDTKPPIIAYLIGNEISASSIISTNAAHPDMDNYAGTFIDTGPNINAAEAFLAEMADYVKKYERDTYGYVSLVSYSNDIRTADLIDTPFLDFRSHNAYSYAVPYYRPSTLPGSGSGTLFQGWIEELKSRYSDKPLLITETGLSVSPNAIHVGPPHYGYGGNTETDQTQGLLQNLDDIDSALKPTAGVVIHEYLDAWWKFGLADSFSQDPDDIEEWFGLVRIVY
jgi:hypothetical protein